MVANDPAEYEELNIPIVLDVGGEDSPISNDLTSMLEIISPNETELERMTGKKGVFGTKSKKKVLSTHALRLPNDWI